MSVGIQLSESLTAVHGRESPRVRRGTPFLAFCIAFVGTLAIALLQGPKPFYYDSGEYWSMGKSFSVDSHFSLLNFSDQLRGYALPLMYHVLQVIDGELAWTSSSMVKIFNVVIFALIGGVLGPRLAQIAWPGRPWGLGRRMILSALLIVFWSGDLNFPLSDFPALALAMLALVAIARPDAPGWMLVAGLASGAATNVRAAYLLLAPILAVLVAWTWLKQHGSKPSRAHRLLCVGLLVAGFAAVSLPQSLSAHRFYGTWSFVPGASLNLASKFLTPGVPFQLYDTYVGPALHPQMNYGDESGARLLTEEKIEEIESWGQYLELIGRHPLTMGAVLARHVINGLDARYSTTYVEQLEGWPNRAMRVAGFLLVFLALVRALWPAARRALRPARWRYVAAMPLCCLTSVPTQIETRYLLPTYLAIYMLVLTPGWPDPLGPRGSGIARYRTLAALTVGGIAFAGIVLYVVSEATRQMSHYAI